MRHVKRIAMEAGVDPGLARACIQNLCYFGVVKIIPIFQFCNTYCITPQLIDLKEDEVMRKQFLEHASLDPEKPVTFREAFTFVTSLVHGTTVRDLCIRFDVGKKLMLNPIRLIQFLVSNVSSKIFCLN